MHFKENINKNDNCNDENYHNDDKNNNDRTRRKPLIFNHKLNCNESMLLTTVRYTCKNVTAK